MSRVSCILILILIVPYIKYQKPKGYSPVPVPEENLPLRFFPPDNSISDLRSDLALARVNTAANELSRILTITTMHDLHQRVVLTFTSHNHNYHVLSETYVSSSEMKLGI